MRQKIGTALNKDIVKRARMRATQEGRAFNKLLEDTLQSYLSRRSGSSATRVVEESWGVFKVSSRELREALKGEIFEA